MIAIMAFSEKGVKLGEKLAESLSEVFGMGSSYVYAPEKYCSSLKIISCEFSEEFMKQQFENAKALIFISALGIAVRKIAPFIKNKTTDPAVISIDELAHYVIPVLSGHIGGANKLATEISEILNATTVITTATDINNKFAVDVWATENQYYIENPEGIKFLSSAILHGKKIGIFSEFPIEGDLPENFLQNKEELPHKYGLHIAKKLSSKSKFEYELKVIPKYITIGMGCKRNIPFATLKSVFLDMLKQNNISVDLIKCIATIDLKKDELALKQLAFRYKLKLIFYTADELNKVEGEFTKSEFVKQITSVDNVCERSAVLASQNGRLIAKKIKNAGVTVAIAEEDWRVRF